MGSEMCIRDSVTTLRQIRGGKFIMSLWVLRTSIKRKMHKDAKRRAATAAAEDPELRQKSVWGYPTEVDPETGEVVKAGFKAQVSEALGGELGTLGTRAGPNPTELREQHDLESAAEGMPATLDEAEELEGEALERAKLAAVARTKEHLARNKACLLYTSPSPRDS